MKLRRDFVTNSSSTSYVVSGFKLPKEIWFEDNGPYLLDNEEKKSLGIPEELQAFYDSGRVLVGSCFKEYDSEIEVSAKDLLAKTETIKECAAKFGVDLKEVLLFAKFHYDG